MKRDISEHFEEKMPIGDTHELVLAFASVVLTSILTHVLLVPLSNI